MKIAARRIAKACLRHALGRVRLLRRPASAVYQQFRGRRHIAQRSPFDLSLGIDTSGFLPGYLLASGHQQDVHVTGYIGCAPSLVRHVLGQVPAPANWHLVDLGCGKGRALAVASEFAFRSLTGLEISPELAQVAAANARHIAHTHPSRTRIDIHIADASQPVITGPTVLVMYHAFGPTLVARLLEAVVVAGQDVILIYINSVHADLIDGKPGFKRLWSQVVEHVADETPYALDDRETVIIWRFTQFPV